MSYFYKVYFCDHRIQTTVTSSACAVDAWIANLLFQHEKRIEKQLVVGLDTEWCLDNNQTVAILQLCVGHKCLVFQIKKADAIPQSLEDFFANKKFEFVGVNVKEDAEKLQKDYGLRVSSTMDVRYKFAKKYRDPCYRESGLKRMCSEFLNMPMEKPKYITMSKWDKEKLLYAQVRYAAIDAFVSFQLAMEAKKPLEEPIKYSDDIYWS